MTAKVKPKLGPAMEALSPMQRKFVRALYDNPALDGTSALRMAGYRYGPASAGRQSHRWRHDEKVLAAITEYGRNEYQAKLPLAVGVVGDILKDPKSRDRLRAVHGVLDRAGLGPTRETHVTVTHQFDRADLLGKIASLLERNTPTLAPAGQNGGDAAKLAAAHLPVITDGSKVTVRESEAAHSAFNTEGEAAEKE
jgi:hypothetical protein